jgi:hypothetical protein
MKFFFRLILFIMVVLIFIFVFAGQGIFDSFLPLMDAKAVITTTFKGGVFDYGDGERYLVKKSEADEYMKYMLDQGWTLTDMGDDYYIFQKDGKDYKFEREEVLKFFYKFKVD